MFSGPAVGTVRSIYRNTDKNTHTTCTCTLHGNFMFFTHSCLYLSIRLFDSKPVLDDEEKLLLRLQIVHHDVATVPALVLALSRVVMPQTQILHRSQRSRYSRGRLDRTDLRWICLHVYTECTCTWVQPEGKRWWNRVGMFCADCLQTGARLSRQSLQTT